MDLAYLKNLYLTYLSDSILQIHLALEKKGGTGLGMSIAQSVVKAHRGFICATTSCASRTSSDQLIDDTMVGSESSESKPHGLTLTVVLPNVIFDDENNKKVKNTDTSSMVTDNNIVKIDNSLNY